VRPAGRHILFNHPERVAHIATAPRTRTGIPCEHPFMSSASTVLDPLRAGLSSSTTLVQALQLSRPTVSRALTTLQREGRVLKMGVTRGTRYGLLRDIPGAGSSWPVYQVNTAGRSRQIGVLHALMPRHFHFESDRAAMHGQSDGLPWFLADQRPAALSEEQFLAWCVHEGWDCPGDLLIGADAHEHFLSRARQQTVIADAGRSVAYPGLAEEALATGSGIAQIGGEQPKFTVLTSHGGHKVPVLVKFSPPLDTAEGRRWADLLMAEHIAHLHLNTRGVGAVHSRAYRYGGRIFLEIDRFDRVGADGRRGVVSLAAMRKSGSGTEASWSGIAARLAASGVLPRNDARQIRLIEAFALLIGNTDLDHRNLSLFDRHDGRFALAPAYDMLPMIFAPAAGNGSARSFTPPEPVEALLDVWQPARRLAETYWERLATEPQLSQELRALCASAHAALRAAP
jgi:hypothetical protein